MVPSVNAQARAKDASDIAAPVATVEAEYDLGDAINAPLLPGCVVLPTNDCKTRIRARVYRPSVLTGPHPLLVFLHGNHGTCGSLIVGVPEFPGNPRFDDDDLYTRVGVCPPASPLFAPSYLGYAYLASRLASANYVVVSIDANRGITGLRTQPLGVTGDLYLIRARARLVLMHLQLLSECNTNGGTGLPACDALQGHLDFDQVGLMGHSRGGEGVRAAYTLYQNDPRHNWRQLITDPVTIRGIFEIAPTDNMTGMAADSFNVMGTAWNVLLPMCDLDVSDLDGIKPFDRQMLEFENPLAQKSSYLVWGTNHNFFNTQWQIADGARDGCVGPGNTAVFTELSPGSAQQRRTAISSVLAFFRANVGAAADAEYNQNFNPLYEIPERVDGILYPTRVFRGYVPSSGVTSSLLFNDFDGPANASSYGIPDQRSAGVGAVVHGSVTAHDAVQRAGHLSWNGVGGPGLYYQMNWTAMNKPGKSVAGYATLDFRISRQSDPANANGTTNFSIRLVAANGVMTRPVNLNRYTDFRDGGGARGPGGPRGPVGNDNSTQLPILQTVRIPLSHFGNFDAVKNQVRGVRFVFDQDLNAGNSSGAVYIANVRFVNTLGSGAGVIGPFTTSSSAVPNAPAALTPPVVHPGSITALRRRSSIPALDGQPGVEIWLQSSRSFDIRNNALVLNIRRPDQTQVLQSVVEHQPVPDDKRIVVFSLTDAEFAQAITGDRVQVQYGFGTAGESWDFGVLDRSMLVTVP